MKIGSWNVNSLNVRLAHVLQWLEDEQPDVLGLQETKTIDKNFPRAEIEARGYHIQCAGQKTYNGVALLSREPATEVFFDIPMLQDKDRRLIGATINGMRIINLYVVNGQTVGSEKYAHKLAWLGHIYDFVAKQCERYDKIILMGDFNITPDDRDVHDPQAWRGKVLCSDEERGALQRLLDLGFVDTYRHFVQAPQHFSWWDYRAGGFRRNNGLRIDLILASTALMPSCTRAEIDIAPRRLERPSDHTPVLAQFTLSHLG